MTENITCTYTHSHLQECYWHTQTQLKISNVCACVHIDTEFFYPIIFSPIIYYSNNCVHNFVKDVKQYIPGTCVANYSILSTSLNYFIIKMKLGGSHQTMIIEYNSKNWIKIDREAAKKDWKSSKEKVSHDEAKWKFLIKRESKIWMTKVSKKYFSQAK